MRRVEIAGYEGLYWIGDDGVVYKRDGARLFGSVNSHGYKVVSLTKNGKKKDHKVHRLLAVAFVPNPCPGDFDCVNHIDGDKLNNSIGNLEWCTKAMNNAHARTELCRDYGPRAVMQMTRDGELVALWANASKASEFCGVSATLIRACCNGTAQNAGDYVWQDAPEGIRHITAEIRRAELECRARRLSDKLKQIENEIAALR